MKIRHLILPPTLTHGNQLLEQYCLWTGIEVERVENPSRWNPSSGCSIGTAAVQGGPAFTREIARRLGGVLLEPADDWLAKVPAEYLKREIELTTLKAARHREETKFVKPVNDKYFPARVYEPIEQIPVSIEHDHELVIISEPVEWLIEYRAFVLDRAVQSLSRYRMQGSEKPSPSLQDEAAGFCTHILRDSHIPLPKAVVVDVGLIRGRGWAIVEANAANMCSLYDCEPEKVLPVLACGVAVLQ